MKPNPPNQPRSIASRRLPAARSSSSSGTNANQASTPRFGAGNSRNPTAPASAVPSLGTHLLLPEIFTS